MPAEIPDGAVIVARAIVNSSLWTMRDQDRILALTCIVKANWKERKWFDGIRTITIRRGQFVTSIRSLSKDACLSEKSVRTSLKRLEKAEFLARKATQHYTLITIPKYDFYQDLNKYSDSTGTESGTPLAQTGRTPGTTPAQTGRTGGNKQEGYKGKEGNEGEEDARGPVPSPKKASRKARMVGVVYKKANDGHPLTDFPSAVHEFHAAEKRGVDHKKLMDSAAKGQGLRAWQVVKVAENGKAPKRTTKELMAEAKKLSKERGLE